MFVVHVVPVEAHQCRKTASARNRLSMKFVDALDRFAGLSRSIAFSDVAEEVILVLIVASAQ